jgi:hypothetical protein
MQEDLQSSPLFMPAHDPHLQKRTDLASLVFCAFEKSRAILAAVPVVEASTIFLISLWLNLS